MTQEEKQDLKLIMYRLDESDKRVDELHTEFRDNLINLHTDIKFIKENLFNPNEGLWAETKLNSQHRKNTSNWLMVIGAGVIAALGDMFWDFFSN
tara:strand:+ start:1565 stop:1849 length:285 start_codon:yes stop_codon:yes gene_type:complete